MILCMSSPRERTDREELLKKKKRERERVRTYSPSQKQKKKRSDCLAFKVCVCVLLVWIFWRKVKPFVLFQTKGAERAGDIFFPCALLKSDEAKKKISSSSKKHIKEGEPTTNKEKENHNTFASFFLPSLKSAHTNTNTHTHTRTRTIYPTTTTTS